MFLELKSYILHYANCIRDCSGYSCSTYDVKLAINGQIIVQDLIIV